VAAKLNLALDCRYYNGDRPCEYHRKYDQLCRCPHYEPMGTRILIIKCRALGDVVRTASLLPTLKRTYDPSHITWVSEPNGVRILSGHPLIDKLVTFDTTGVLAVTAQEFDLVICLDKDAGPTVSRWGTPQPCDARCEPYFQLGLDNDLKFKHNTRSYPQLIHDAVGLDYLGEPYRLYVDDLISEQTQSIFARWRADHRGPMIGLNTGAGPAFANKAPTPSRWVELAKQLVAHGYAVVLLGGPREVEKNAWIMQQLAGKIHDTGCNNTEQQFVALVDQCDAVVTGDTLALHVAVARRVPVIALFGPTCEQEIDLFGLGQKVLSQHDCGPCYRRHCDRDPNCMDAIPIEQIVAAVEAVCLEHCSTSLDRPTCPDDQETNLPLVEAPVER